MYVPFCMYLHCTHYSYTSSVFFSKSGATFEVENMQDKIYILCYYYNELTHLRHHPLQKLYINSVQKVHSRHRDKTIELLDVDASALFYGQTLSSKLFKYIFLALKNTKKKDIMMRNILTLKVRRRPSKQGSD